MRDFICHDPGGPWPTDYRWRCSCGRFLPASAVTEEDYLDPSAYYGIGTRTTGQCPKCGACVPKHTPTRWSS